MNKTSFVNDARVMSKGQVTIPKNIREVLGIEPGDRVTFMVEGNTVRILNSVTYALMIIQNQMKDETNKTSFMKENDIDEWITNSRRKEISNKGND